MAGIKVQASPPLITPARLTLWQEALALAERDLQSERPSESELRAKALAAVVRAAAAIQDVMSSALHDGEEDDDDPEAARRALEARIDRIRRERGLAPVFEIADDYPD